MNQQQVAAEMAKFLSGIPQYRELQQAAAAVKQRPELVKTLRDFKTTMVGIHSQEQGERIRQEYRRLSQTPELGRYFHASEKYGEAIGAIMNDANTMLENSLGL